MPICGFDENAHHRARAAALVNNAHLVVKQAHDLQVRVKLLQRFSQGVVECIDGAVALRGCVHHLVVNAHLQHHLRADVACASVV